MHRKQAFTIHLFLICIDFDLFYVFFALYDKSHELFNFDCRDLHKPILKLWKQSGNMN